MAHATENAPPHSGSALGSASAPGPALRGLSDFQNPSCGVLPPQGASETSKGVGGLLLREPAGRHVRGTGAIGNLAGLGVSRGMGGLVRGEDAGASPGCQNERPGGAPSQLLGVAMMIRITPQMRILVAVEPSSRSVSAVGSTAWSSSADSGCRMIRSAAGCWCSAGRRGTAIKGLFYCAQGDGRYQKGLSREGCAGGVDHTHRLTTGATDGTRMKHGSRPCQETGHSGPQAVV